MSFTLFGAIVALVGLWLLLRGSMLSMLLFVMVASLFGGSSAINLPALGGSSIPPANLALLFLLVRCARAGDEPHHRLGTALDANRWLLLFALYGAAGAMLLPRIFEGAIDVTPLRPIPGYGLYAAFPLRFSNQNITSAGYLLGTMLAAVAATMVLGRESAWRPVARTAAILGAVHALLGVLGVVLAGTPFDAVLGFFRNASYSQLSHNFGGIVRMNGIWPEAAGFSAHGIVWMIFLSELWVRGIESRWTGPAALLLLLALLGSTSSTALIGIGGYGALLMLRVVYGSGAISGDRRAILAAIGLAATAAFLAVFVLVPGLADKIAEIARLTTVEKLESGSGMQRMFWARLGLDAFIASYGLGVGPGSFRSSSILTAILGSVGAIGSLAFVAHLWRVFLPLRRSTWVVVRDPRAAVGAAASWTAVAMLIPASLSAPSPDPGQLWGIMCGVALGLRWVPLPVPSDARPPHPGAEPDAIAMGAVAWSGQPR
jgi:hypothetical protein